MTSEKLKPTPGPWTVHSEMRDCVTFEGRHGTENLFLQNLDGYFACQNEVDATLIAEAGTVFHECGLSPRELLEAVRELHEALATIYDQCGGYVPDTYKSAWSQAFAALAKHKEV
ncbi:hypothetical protein [Comamonas sp. B21-038]|uniref:hypothetical protein n=1 Tax=Comamonas sp. B21-038 TaxID=2918299 RepID=UPI001EFBD7E4|nr:hypothetical protein [Comamonas sp. B21-038]ULR87436.1 hypothetical protein MJ205_13275 [Comamonas sp. B21-038]